MTVAIGPIDGEVVLNETQAVEVTKRIRKWVRGCPIEDIKAAYFGRVWISLNYKSWHEWCDGELGGFTLPAVDRRGVVAQLSELGMSNRSIAEVIGVSRETVNRDKAAGDTFVSPDPDRPVTGQDGKQYRRNTPTQPKDKPVTTPMKEQRDYIGRSHFKRQLVAVGESEMQLRGVAVALEARFSEPGFEKTFTPETAAKYAKSYEELLERIAKQVSKIKKHGEAKP